MLPAQSQSDKIQEWPFTKPQAVAPPRVEAADRVRNEIDSFVLHRLEKAGLTLSAEASKRTLVRRLHFDLTGLPPSPDEVDAFVNSSDPRAYENLVDTLLDSPRFGERWAKFWLDLARYADTAGYEGDPDLPHAWRYRDYVIDSFNRDKPYDLFIKEQIAGDEFDEIMGAGELPLPTAERTVAMTFLRLAPFTEPRGDETRHEMLSEMTSTVSSVFLGLTVGCSKCHDHKYDQIPTKDFYRMKAFFNTVQLMPPERGDAFQIGGSLPASFYRKGEAEWAASKRKEIESLEDEFDSMTAMFKERASSTSSSGKGSGFGLQSMVSGNDYFYDQHSIDDGELHLAIAMSDGKAWTFSTDQNESVPAGSLAGSNDGDWFGDLENARYISIGQHGKGNGEPSGNAHTGSFAELMIYDRVLDKEGRRAMSDYFHRKYRNAPPEQVHEPALPQEGLQFWLDASDIDADPATVNPKAGSSVSQWVDKVNGLALKQQDLDKQPKLKKQGHSTALHFGDDFLIASAETAPFLGNQTGTIVAILSVEHKGEGYGFEAGGNGAFFATVVNPSAQKSELSIEQWVNDPMNNAVSDQERARFNQLRGKVPFIKQQIKRLEPRAMSVRHSFGPPYEPGVPVSRVLVRGEYDNPGEVVEAGFLSAITGNQEPAEIRLDPFKRWPTRSRRMALAQWIASPDNPLTARVMMNRLWLWHFGQGIVSTPSDFGKLSGGPSHSQLLDWLAVRFVEENWSLKAMHRLIVTSNTYRQASGTPSAEALAMDPENRLLSRAIRHRLEAEAVRDAVLATSGRLNPEVFGLPIFPPLPDGIEQRIKYSNSKWATETGPESRKRSIYIYQQRTLTMPFMQTFDGLVCEDTMPRRQTSVTPLQALAMYNGILANEEAAYFAKRVISESGPNPEQRIRRAFAIALGREPEQEEIAELLSFAESEQKLVGLCRILYNTSEFIYVD